MSSQPQRIRFMQVSDVFLDARLSDASLGMSVRQRQARNAEALDSLVELCGLAKERDADAFVIAGNLWDGQSVTPTTISALVRAFSSLDDIPVLIAPGRLDPLTALSFHRPGIANAYDVEPWSGNVHIFGDENFVQFPHPSQPRLSFAGRACVEATSTPVSARNGSAGIERPIGTTTVCIDPMYVESEPFDAEGYDYCVLGGSPSFNVVRRVGGQIVGASSGTLISRNVEESEERNALWIELHLQNDDSDLANVTIERLPSDRRRIVPVSVSINGIRPATLSSHVRKIVKQSDASPQDILHLRISGLYPLIVRPEFGLGSLSKNYYHVLLDDASRPDYTLDKLDLRTTEARFIQRMQELKHTTEAKSSAFRTEHDLLSSRTVDDALCHGLEALSHRKVTVTDVD